MDDQNPENTPPSAPNGDSKAMQLRLEFQEWNTSVAVTITGETIIGRRDPESEEIPDIDLTPYGGYQKGISRHHAVLHVQDGKLCLTDLGSRNGTYLNGHRIPIWQTALVNDGDEVRLGQIVFYIYRIGQA